MLIYEYKVDGTPQQYAAIEEAIRVVQFIRNKALRLWMDTRGTSKNDLQCLCAPLAREFSFARRLNSQAGKPLPRAPGSPSNASMTIASTTNPARKAIPVSSMTTAPSSTSKRAGSWNRTASTSPSRMAVASVGSGSSGTTSSKSKPFQ